MRRRIKVAPRDGAQFFKVFLPRSSKKLTISPAFIKDFKRTIREKIILKAVGGRQWHVDVKETPHGVFLMNGWQNYVDHHGLKVGEFLVFQYDGSFSFIVKMFGINGCKRNKVLNNDTHVKIEKDGEEEIKEELTSSKRQRTHKEDQSFRANGRTEHSERFGEEKQEPSMETQNAEGVISESPCFITSSLSSNMVRIPDEVMAKLNFQLKPNIILRNVSGKDWNVKISKYGQKPFIGSGWSVFRNNNNLGSTDSCKFTIETETLINVEILRREPDLSGQKRGRGCLNSIASDNLAIVRPRVQKIVTSSDEKVPSPVELPEFFKIHAVENSSQKMGIPPEFIKEFGENIPTTCKLENLSGLSWKVDMNRINDHWFFQEGWSEFVLDNSVEDRDFLTFAYDGNSTFRVNVYSRSGCIKVPESIDDETTENLLEIETPNHESPMNKRETRSSSRHRQSFELELIKSHLTKCCLPIPINFWRSYLNVESKLVTLVIKDEKWFVHLKNLGDRYALAKGQMPRFIKENCLKRGTRCIFELCNSNHLDFLVTVIH